MIGLGGNTAVLHITDVVCYKPNYSFGLGFLWFFFFFLPPSVSLLQL